MQNRIQKIIGAHAEVAILQQAQAPIEVNKWIYIATFLLFSALSSLAFYLVAQERHQSHLDTQSELIQVARQTVEQGFFKSAQLVFNNIINQPKYQQALFEANTASESRQSALRQQIYQQLLPVYESMATFRLKQLHFHLHNNNSFLRFHRPLKFGDNLTRVRPTVAYVNQTGQLISGFEEGRIFNGYRFVFPLFWQNQPAGSVETSVAIRAILEEMSKELGQRVGFFISKKVVLDKVFNSEQKNYVETPFSKDFLYERDSGGDSCCQLLSEMLSHWRGAEQLSQWLDPVKIKTTFIEYLDREYLVSFVPVKNPVTKQTVGYMAVTKEHLGNEAYQDPLMWLWLASLMIGFVLTFLLYVLKRDEILLQRNNHRIQSQNELFSKAQELVNLGTWELNVQSNELYWSDEVFRIMGEEPQSFEPTFERFLEFIHPDDRQALTQLYERSIKERENYQIEHRILTSQGVMRYVSEEGEHIYDKNGLIIRSIGTIHDVTELRQNEKSLLALKNRYQRLLEDLPVVVYRFRFDGSYEWRFVNKTIQRFTGYSAEQILQDPSKTFFDLIHPDDRAMVQVKLTQHDFSNGPLEMDYRICHHNGAEFYMSDLLRRVDAPEGGWIIEGMMNDHTEHFESMQRMQKLIDHQSNIVIIANMHLINYANKSFYEFLGLKQHNSKSLQAVGDLANHFIKRGSYFHLGRMPAGKTNWIKALLTWPEDKRIVAMTNAVGAQKVFKVELSDLEDGFYLISLFDITQAQLEKQRWQYKASHDTLTGCHNRDFLEMNLEVFLQFVKRQNNLVGMLLMDLDHFKKINDSFGHNEGDRVLSETADLIYQNIRESDLFIRWGGEEFLLLMAVDSVSSLEQVAKNLGRVVEENIETPAGNLTISMGGTILENKEDLEPAIGRADAGLYFVKAHGRNGYLFVADDP